MIANTFYELSYPVKEYWQHLTINSKDSEPLKKGKGFS